MNKVRNGKSGGFVKSILKNFIYNTGYQILTVLIPLITTPYLSRIIGAKGIGQYAYAYSFAYYFVIFITLGLNNYGNRTIAGVRDNKDELAGTFWELYTMQVLFGVIVTIIYIITCIFTGGNFSLKWAMLLYVISAVFDINWFFFGLEKFKFTTIRNAIIKIISTILIFLLVKEKSDLILYVLITVIGSLLGCVILWPLTFRIVGKPRIRINDCKKHIIPNLILFVPIIAVSLYKVMDKIMLGQLSTMEQVGYYEYSEKIIQIPMSIVNSLAVVMLPRMSNLVATKNSKSEKKYISLSIIFVMFLATSLCFGIMGIAREFVPFFYGLGYEPCINLFYILLPSCCFVAFSSVVRTQYLIPHKNDKIYIISVFVGAIVNLGLNLLLIPRMQSVGAAVATFASEGVVFFYQSIMVRKKIEIMLYLKNSLCFLLAGIGMFGVLVTIDIPIDNILWIMLIKVMIGVVCYFLFFILCLQFNKDEKETLIKIYRKLVKREG